MGNPFPVQEREIEKRGIEELRALSEEAKGVLNHHLRNSLMVIKGNAELLLSKSAFFVKLRSEHLTVNDMFEKLESIIAASDHILEDLKNFGLENK